MADPGPDQSPRTSTRDMDELQLRLTKWLAANEKGPGTPKVSNLVVPEANGMSSETFLFDITGWANHDTAASHDTAAELDDSVACVGRMAPADSDMPVFPSYDFALQAKTMRVVRDGSGVPAPRVLFFEPDAAALGSPFLIMERIDGLIPADVMPYTFEGWLFDASPVQRRRLQTSTVELLANIHTITPDHFDLGFLPGASGTGSNLQRHVAATRRYAEWISNGRERPLIERSLQWLDANWPTEESPAALSWGDSRIGNIIYRDFEPVGMLDWEMADLGPPEMDVAWLIFMHRFFQDITQSAGLPGLPDFLRPDDVVALYEQAAGITLKSMDFFMVYAGVRHAVVMSRVQERMALAAGQPLPDDPDDLIMHRSALEEMIA